MRDYGTGRGARKSALALALALGFALALAAAPAWAGDGGPTVSVTGQASLSFPPEQVELVVGVTTEAPGAGEAAQENAAAMTRVTQALKKALAGKGSLKTMGYRVSPRYEYDKMNRQRRLVGFSAVNRLLVTSPDVGQVGALLDAALAAGANTIDGPTWGLKDDSAALTKAQVAALADAQAKASALATAAGMSLGPVVKISASGGDQPGPMMMRMSAEARSAGTPVESGDITVQATVSCTYTLAPRP